jgi:hypothetical protein
MAIAVTSIVAGVTTAYRKILFTPDPRVDLGTSAAHRQSLTLTITFSIDYNINLRLLRNILQTPIARLYHLGRG